MDDLLYHIRLLEGERDQLLDVIDSAEREQSASMRNKNLKKQAKKRMQAIPTGTKKRGPTSRVLQEVIRQAPSEYVTVGWLTSTLHRDSFGIVMLCLGLLATTPVGSTVPGLILAVMAVQLFGNSSGAPGSLRNVRRHHDLCRRPHRRRFF
jgi:Exopolysaccharide synthesis, ExoD